MQAMKCSSCDWLGSEGELRLYFEDLSIAYCPCCGRKDRLNPVSFAGPNIFYLTLDNLKKLSTTHTEVGRPPECGLEGQTRPQGFGLPFKPC